MVLFSLALNAIRSLRNDRRGVTALEYGLIAAVMGALIVTAFTSLGTSMGTAIHQHRRPADQQGLRHVSERRAAGASPARQAVRSPQSIRPQSLTSVSPWARKPVRSIFASQTRFASDPSDGPCSGPTE